MVTVPVMQEELLLVTAAKHPLSKKRKVSAAGSRRQPFVLFESGSNTRRVIDEFFMTAKIEPHIVMETENVEIIKAHGAQRPRHHDRLVPIRGARRRQRPSLLRAHRRGAR